MTFLGTVDEWNLRNSPLHRRDARVKILSTVLILIAIGRGELVLPAIKLVIAILVAGLPLVGVFVRAGVVLPFAITFAAAALFSGRFEFASHLVIRTYLSAICTLVLVGTTPLAALLNGLKRLGVPPLLVEVVHFVHRYLSVIWGQSVRMTIAAKARGSGRSLLAVVGSVAVLFASSLERAEAIHRAMLARGYRGSLPWPRTPVRWADALLAGLAVISLAASFR